MQLSSYQLSPYKKLFLTALAATVLTLSACDKKDDSTMEGSVHEFDAETSEEEAAAEIAAENAPMISDREDNPVLPSSDEPENTGAVMGDMAPAAKDTTGGVSSTVNSEVVLDNEVKQTPTSSSVETSDITNNSDNDMIIEETNETY